MRSLGGGCRATDHGVHLSKVPHSLQVRQGEFMYRYSQRTWGVHVSSTHQVNQTILLSKQLWVQVGNYMEVARPAAMQRPGCENIENICMKKMEGLGSTDSYEYYEYSVGWK